MSVSSVAVVGGGPRGMSIAEAVAEARLPVVVMAHTEDAARLSRKRIERTLALRLQAGELSAERREEILALVRVTTDLAHALEGCDLVIEATVGDLRSRRALLATLESRMSRGAVLAASADRGDLDEMAEVLERRDQFLGLRFRHPATHSKVVEVAALTETAPGAVAACETLVRWLSKTPIAPTNEDAQQEGSKWLESSTARPSYGPGNTNRDGSIDPH